MDTKLKRFKEFVFDAFCDMDQFDKIEYNLLRIRNLLVGRHDFFKNMTAFQQYEMCVTVSTIAIDTMRQHLNENKPLFMPDKSKEFPFSQDWGFKEPVVLIVGKELRGKILGDGN